jgi:hypothetical protein
LPHVLKHFDDVYLFVDALDEYARPERAGLLDTFQKIGGFDVKGLHLLVSSRREGDISTAVLDIADTSEAFQEVQVQGSRITKGLGTYLDQKLKSRSFGRWNPQERKDVRSYLSPGSDGM